MHLDFSTNGKGVISCNDFNGQPIPVDIIEEFSEVAIFRKKQNEVDMGIPLDTWELGD
jgi:hypothetical protein